MQHGGCSLSITGLAMLLIACASLCSATPSSSPSTSPSSSAGQRWIIFVERAASTAAQYHSPVRPFASSLPPPTELPVNLTLLWKYHSTRYANRSLYLVQGGLAEAQLYTQQLVATGLRVKLTQDVEGAVYVNPLTVVNPAAATLSWGLDRIDQRTDDLDGQYNPVPPGPSPRVVHAYVVDTGVSFDSDFPPGVVSQDYSYDTTNYNDCYGHGTHVGGIIGSVHYGVMQGQYIRIHSVKVLGCDGSGALSDLLAGLMWVESNLEQPAVINLSLEYTVYDASIASVLSSLTTLAYVSAAGGNDDENSCDVYPGSETGLEGIGATTSVDARASYSNYGTCLGFFAPGDQIVSLWLDNGTQVLSGTSMATAFSTGAGALYLRDHPTPSNTPAVASVLLASADTGDVTSAGTGSPNLLLYVGSWTPPPPGPSPSSPAPAPPPPPPAPAPTPSSPTPAPAPPSSSSSGGVATLCVSTMLSLLLVVVSVV